MRIPLSETENCISGACSSAGGIGYLITASRFVLIFTGLAFLLYLVAFAVLELWALTLRALGRADERASRTVEAPMALGPDLGWSQAGNGRGEWVTRAVSSRRSPSGGGGR